MSEVSESKPPRHIFAVRLRALVLALGEKSIPAWWKTEFMNETGLRFLERLYPRTPVNAAVYAAGRAASDIHDKAVGRIGVYHLFRLPESLETEIHAYSAAQDVDFIKQFRSSLDVREELMDMLCVLCSDQSVKSNTAGPIRIGTESEASGIDALSVAASIYRDAFERGKPAFPYFAPESKRIGG